MENIDEHFWKTDIRKQALIPSIVSFDSCLDVSVFQLYRFWKIKITMIWFYFCYFQGSSGLVFHGETGEKVSSCVCFGFAMGHQISFSQITVRL